MHINLPEIGSMSTLNRVWHAVYGYGMAKKPKEEKPLIGIRKVIATNVQALLDRDVGVARKGQIGRFIKKHAHMEKALSKMQRAVNEGAMNLDTMEQLAKVFGVSPYQLLIEGLNPKAPQVAIERHLVKTAQRMAKELAEMEDVGE